MAIHGLSIYLLKETVSDPSEIIDYEKATDLDEVPSAERAPWLLAVRQAIDKSPGWAAFFHGHIDVNIFGKAHSLGAALFVPAAGRWFALTFGTGRYLLQPGCWEERFGLRVALNSLDEDKLRSIDKKSFEAIPLHAREQVSEDSGTAAFGLDVERDLLRAVTGTPSDKALGLRLTGMDSLKAHVEIDLPNLDSLLIIYFEKFLDTSYKKKFPWVDHISEVTDKGRAAELDRLVSSRFASNDLKGCWLACPEIIDWAEVRGFRYGQSRRNLAHYDLHLRDFLASIAPDVADCALLAKRRVFCSGDDDRVIKDWSIYECLNCEVDHEGSVFLLSSGRWFCISPDFVAKVDGFIEKIPRYDKPLPTFSDINETIYNRRVAEQAPHGFALMDRKNIRYGGGPSQLEFCDLFTRERDLIHVKQYGGSSPLSHLFSQGLNSADLFLGEEGFRREVHRRLPESHRLFDPVDRPHPEAYQVVFAIISQSQGPLWLPFFSRLSLRHACKRLHTLGYRFALAKIDVEEETAKVGRASGTPTKTF
jgi:uncharacterized protein (TIGR04141 family)